MRPLGVFSMVLLPTFLCAGGLACRRTPPHAASSAMPIAPLFGPIVSREVIGGRTGDGRGTVWLLAGGEAIVRVNMSDRVTNRLSLAVSTGERCWGLARLDDGSMWTLRGRTVLAQIGSGGEIVREIPLREPHFGLYANGSRLVFQPARFVPSGRLLMAGAPEDSHPEPWSEIEPRAFPALARASAAALNMVACGQTRTKEQPCWFPDAERVALIQPDGRTRVVALDGLMHVPPEVLLTADNPPRPIRDVFVDETGALWVLSSGTPPPGAADEPGGWLLARYSGSGALARISRLSEQVRLILRADSHRVLVLTGSGMVGEVVP